jgi:hypothetical protein
MVGYGLTQPDMAGVAGVAGHSMARAARREATRHGEAGEAWRGKTRARHDMTW